MLCGKANYGNYNARKLKYVMFAEVCVHVKKCALCDIFNNTSYNGYDLSLSPCLFVCICTASNGFRFVACCCNSKWYTVYPTYIV